MVRGRLRLYSASGFFLFLGLVVLAMGIGMATLGYWPQSETRASTKVAPGAGGGSKRETAGGTKMSAAGAKMPSSGEANGAKMAVSEGNLKVNSSSSQTVQGNQMEEQTINHALKVISTTENE